MKSRLGCLAVVIVTWMVAPLAQTQAPVAGRTPAKPTELEGVWLGQSLEANGLPGPPEAAALMRFTFKGDRLLIRGNSPDGREEELVFTSDPGPTPRHFDFHTPNGDLVTGIYELKGDVLAVCMRRGEGARPPDFNTAGDGRLIKIVFKRSSEK